jgi:hypothetical protein
MSGLMLESASFWAKANHQPILQLHLPGSTPGGLDGYNSSFLHSKNRVTILQGKWNFSCQS